MIKRPLTGQTNLVAATSPAMAPADGDGAGGNEATLAPADRACGAFETGGGPGNGIGGTLVGDGTGKLGASGRDVAMPASGCDG